MGSGLGRGCRIFCNIELDRVLFPTDRCNASTFFGRFRLVGDMVLPLMVFSLARHGPVVVVDFSGVPSTDLLRKAGVIILRYAALTSLLAGSGVNFLCGDWRSPLDLCFLLKLPDIVRSDSYRW